jgi:folate-binding protein YgfZ
MPSVTLNDRAIISISGPDAEHFLQNILTTDLDALKNGEAKAGALLAPQGKIMFDFLISRAGENALRIDCRADVADDFIRRLMLYRLRAKAEISKQEQALVQVSWGDDSNASRDDSSCVRDTRFSAIEVFRTYGTAATASEDIALWNALRITNGVAESGDDYALGDAFPHDVLLDQLDGVGFRKGCYIGQEVVSRMQHRGTARRRVLLVESDAALPDAGADISVNGRTVGTLGSVDGTHGLAIARIDRVKDAMDAGAPIEAGGVTLTLSIPEWARFTFPQAASGTEDS